MKIQIRLWTAAVCVWLLLAGCGQTDGAASVQQTDTAVAEVYTQADILNIFHGYAYADPANREVIGCAVMPDSRYGIIGAVLYTTQDYDGCWLDFLTEGPPYTLAVELKPAEDSGLTAAQADTVICQLINARGETVTCRIICDFSRYESGFHIAYP